MNGLDLFSGIGGISFALKQWVRTVAYCECDRYAQGVLLSRMRSGDIDRAPIWDDVRTLRAEHLPRIDIISGGFPCRDISFAGVGKGLAGERSGLFFEIVRLVGELRPSFIFLENVPAITVRGLDRVLLDLTSLGYDSRWTIVSAAEVGAPHFRERWFLLAHANNGGRRQKQISECGSENTAFTWNDGEKEFMANADGLRKRQSPISRETKRIWFSNGGEKMANSNSKGLERQREKPIGTQSKLGNISNEGRWITEPNVGRVVNGLPMRMDRIRCLGNSVVPQAAQKAFLKLLCEK